MMRAAAMLIAIFALGVTPALADAALEARVLRLEAQVKTLQEALKNAVQMDRVYSVRTANGQPDACLSSKSPDASAAKAELSLGKCDDGDSGPRSWKIGPAQRY
jgi:hypothetical protein